jgi:hypothetical protein
MLVLQHQEIVKRQIDKLVSELCGVSEEIRIVEGLENTPLSVRGAP